MTWWQVLIIITVNSLLNLAAVFIGGYLVFKTRHAQWQIPLLQKPDKHGEDVVGTYNTEFDDDMAILDEEEEEISEDVRRLHEQHG